MTNEAAQLSSEQRRPLSPLTTSHSDSPKGANGAVCYMSRYLLQMETAFARFAWQGKTRRRGKRPGAASPTPALFSGMPGNIFERVGPWAAQSEGKSFRGHLKFARGLGFALQLPLCVVLLREDVRPSFLRCISGSEALRRIFRAAENQKGSASEKCPSQSRAIVVLNCRVR